ncbi:MAG TPA: hypothetical protein DCZ92_00205 [Elusimicrobia bacterium]|nr:MAG: hypothetical protein A2016_09625 [Elusimicrobia bacterium GWF2_62_30]HBA59248.1 hypothetical protein [Elusimicrobiota bacterium]
MDNRNTLIFLALLLAQPLQAATVSLEQAVQAGLKEDNILKEEAERVTGAQAGLAAAKLSRFGGLKLKGMYTDGTDPVYAFATAMKQGTFSMASMASINDPGPARNYMGGIEAGIPLYTGGSLAGAIKMGGLGVAAAEAGRGRARSGITFKLVYQWLTVLLRSELARAAAASEASARKELKTAQMLKDKGMVLGSDYYGAEAILSTLRGYSLNWDSALKLEKEKLALLLGQDPSAAPEAAGKLAESDYTELPSGSEVRDARLDIKAMQKMTELSAVEEKVQSGSYLPVVEAFGSWETNSESLSDFRGSRLVGIKLTVLLGDPAYFAKKDAASARSAMARSRLDEARRRADTEALEAASGYLAAKESLPVAKETLEKASQSLELFRPLYRQGRQSVLEVLRAEASVLQAEAAYYETLYKLHLYHAQALLAAELLDENAVAEMSAKLALK